jgi:uncharacterized membrane protein YkvA (DUF1232 family)
MPIKIAFELSDADLDHFREAIRATQSRVAGTPEEQIIAAARRLAEETGKRAMPDFVRERLAKLSVMTGMLDDKDWRLEEPHRGRVVAALSYFAEPADMIPDTIPGIGFLDDAIIVELVIGELEPEIEAYTRFCAYRDEQRKKSPEELAKQRKAMFARMDRRREQRSRRGGSLFGLR